MSADPAKPTGATPAGATPAEANKSSTQPAALLKLDFEEDALAVGELAAGAKIENAGPTSESFLGLPPVNRALVLNGKGARVRIADGDGESSLDFNDGDAITIEAWVRVDRLSNGANVYVVGKGRTHETKPMENQNYALRLFGAGGEARVSFLFASEAADKKESNYHRWTSDRGFVPDGTWHHVAVSYRFGTPESITGIVDGEKVKGKWDMAGSTKAAPIVDNDSLWIGSSRGGDPGNSLAGAVDSVAIYREILPVSTLTSRRKPIAKPPVFPTSHDDRRVTITLHPGLSSHGTWPALAPEQQFTFNVGQLAFHRLPMRYIAGGLRDPWRGPLLLRAFCRTTMPSDEEVTLLVRSPGLSRLWIDGEIVLTTPVHPLFPDAHQPFEVYQADHPWLHVPRAGDAEKRTTIKLSKGRHDIVLEQIVGAKNIRCETGDVTVAMRRGDELFTLVGPTLFETPLSDEGWQQYRQQTEEHIAGIDRQLRHETTNAEKQFWEHRHALARQTVGARPQIEIPDPVAGLESANEVDRFVNAQIAADIRASEGQATHAGQQSITSDAVFLRRVYLDTIGLLPNADETRAFLNDKSPNKRAALIDRLLADDRWADHWTSYWQDVLAENPSILKPTLNNTGPFRWWIYDALVENKPMDRFVTELIRMEGDKLGGGAAGFSMASENDVPMAAKAHILTSAFLGVEMKCARCHDAPYHPWTQKELFNLAAMLDNKAIKVPSTSSVPKEFFERKKGTAPISLSIFPGDVIEPVWPFDDLNGKPPAAELLGRENPSRERLAAYITSPENDRFAEVMVNRLWHRMFGWGFINHVGDFYEQQARYPQLLKYLSRRFVTDGYDLKATARLILNSRTYQQQSIDGHRAEPLMAYTAPWIRRLTAEQVVDSLYELCGLEFDTEEITFDPSTQQNYDAFLNLGIARRAWQLTSLSNERDRPSLSLPKAAVVVECLEAFGWRGSRQEPVAHRETDANMVQPGVIANSSMSVRLSRMSEGSYFTELALSARSPEEFVERSFEQVLSRTPTRDEMQLFVSQIKDGFDDRITTLALPEKKPEVHRGFVTWANHFDIRANQLMRDVEREIASGPAPTVRLKSDWRERAEDALWALMNSPEFQFVP